MINHFTFNGTSTAQLGLIVSGVSIFGAGSRKVEKARIPGRNGDLQIELGGFNNYTVRYTVSITNNFTTTAQQIREWLLESKGYCELTDTYHPDEIRKACFNSDIEFTTSMLYKYGQASIQFDCLPERYLTTNTPITTTATADTTTDTTMSLSTVPTPINISLNGNTTQEGSSGKNKLPIEAHVGLPYNPSAGTTISPTAKPTQWTNNGNGTFKMTLTSWEQASLITAPLTAGRYVARVTTVTAGMIIGIYVVNADGTSNRVSALKNGTTANEAFQVATTLTAGQYFAFYIAGGSGECTIKEPMVEAGSTATAYEPHISPTNPQVIHSVSGDNVIAISGKNIISGEFMADKLVKEVANSNACYKTEDEHGKCLFFTSSADIQKGVILDTFKPNTRYTVIGREQNATTTGSGANIIVSYTDGTYEFIFLSTSGVTTGTVYDWTFNTASGKSVKSISLYNHHSGNRKLYYEHFGIFEGANATFEPYTRQSYPLYLPVENLIPRPYYQADGTYQGVTWATDNNGKITGSGTTTAGTNFFLTNTSNFTLPAGTYTLSITGTFTGIDLKVYNGSAIIRTIPRGSTNGHATFTLSSASGIRVYFNTGTTGDNVNVSANIQLEKGSKANHYTPYGTTPIELNKIGTYQDYIYKNGGKWYVHKAIGNVTLNGTENWASDSRGFYLETNDMRRTNDYTGNMLCDKLTVYSGATSTDFTSQIYGITGWELSSYPNQNWIYVRANNETTPAGFKTWLSSNHLLVYYQLKTPTNTEITDTTLINQLNNIEKAYSYNGTTNILQVSNDNDFMLEVVSLHGSTFNSNYKGEPIITVNSTGLIYLNGEVMEVLSAPVTINCQTMQCYNGVINMNNEVRVNDFPEIKIGENEVGSSMALTITPNNWRH